MSLSSRLTEILLVTDEAERTRTNPDRVGDEIRKIQFAAREVVESLDALVWTVNPKNDLLDKLGSYIYEYASNFLKSTGIRLRFEVPEKFPDIPLSSERRHHLFLIIKEALNNAVKYSGCTEIVIRLNLDEQDLRLVISDNGKGFLLENVAESGNGIESMKTRARNLDGDFKLVSEPGKGTRAELSLPLHR